MFTKSIGKILFLLLIFLGTSNAFAQLVIKPQECVIVVAGKKRQHKRAAVELALHLKEITGKEIPVITGKAPGGKYIIYIGKTPGNAPQKYTAIEESYWQFGPREAYFYGNDPDNWYKGNRAGPVLYAVYDFLENELNVRWPYPGITCAPKQNPLLLRRQKGQYVHNKPKHYLRTNSVWRERLRFFTDTRLGQGHAFTQWWEKYGKTHPEYFALSQGKRAPITLGNVKSVDVTRTESRTARIIALCVSNPAVVKRIIQNWKGKTRVLNICENDSAAPYSCHCKGCRALDPDPKGKLNNAMGADRYVDFGNRVLKEARKVRKDAKVIYFAYNASEQPPRKTRVAPGTILSLVPTDFRLNKLEEYINNWKKAGMTDFIYRPNWHFYFAPMGFPIGYDRYAFRIHRFIQRSGGSFSYDAPPRNLDPFRVRLDYILLHAMLEPERPFEYWEKHFAEAFGPAQQEVIEYFRFWAGIWEKRVEKKVLAAMTSESYEGGNLTRTFLPRIREFYFKGDFIKSGRFLTRALQKKLTPPARKYLLMLKEFHDHGALMLNCVNTKSMNDIRKLVQFREQHAIGTPAELEKRFDRHLGIRTTPGIDTPILWHFRLDPGNKGIKERWFADKEFSKWDGLMPTGCTWEKPVTVNGHPSAALRKKTANYDGIAWYARKIRIPAQWKNSRIFLHFGAVDEAAEVWVNGKKAGSHPFIKPSDWKTPFDIDITKFIDWSQKEQLVTVQVTDKAMAGGIWKRVEVRFVENWVPVKDSSFKYFGFEHHSKGMCQGWSNAYACTQNPQAGKGCMRQRSRGGSWDVSRYGSYFPVKSGDKYKLSVWNRNTLTSGEAQFMIRFIDKTKAKGIKKNGYIIRKVVTGHKEWEQYEQEFVIPGDCGYIQIFFRVVNPVGEVFWDSVELFRAEKIK